MSPTAPVPAPIEPVTGPDARTADLAPGGASPPTGAGTRRRLLRHLAEMTVAMIAGMVLLGPVRQLLAGALGLAATLDRPAVTPFAMATDMAVGMAVWMWHRGHGARATAEMVAAMYVPFLLLLVPLAAGLLDADALMLGGHLLMLPAMAVVAVRHRHEHPAPPRRHPAVAALVARWPAALALLITADQWFAPSVLPAASLLVLPAGYLTIGTVRRQWRTPGALRTQFLGLVVWSGLAGLALAVGGDTAGWLVAGGWFAHAGWDLWHHRADRVVPRGYSQFCGVLDLVFGVTIALALLAG
ncbi:hypothetical protein [Micromonospora siamensis]|uniref:Uncharacterized protein n=1 Tax=Micromonospora siamensis TaxID=299152 RepID=A0A1C5IUW6_9ACTN|nr:hypothetical protein [Micromonospora siamensis]SCG61801.1 hypothetical protein GA0074704_3810 [Micromonospora siamensis]